MERTFFTKAYNYFKEKKYDEAIENLNLGLIHNKEYYYTYLLFGMIYLKQHKYEAARENFETCIKIAPKKENALLKLSVYYKIKNNDEKEYEYIKKSFDNNPEQYDSLLAFGKINIYRKEYDTAIETFNKALELFSDRKESNEIKLGLARAFNDKGDKEQCDKIINDLLKENQNNASYYELKSLIMKNRYRNIEAKKQIDIAIKIEPNNEKLKIKRVVLEYYLEHYDTVIIDGVKLIEQSEESSRQLFTLNFYIASSYRHKDNLEMFEHYMKLYENQGKKGDEYYYEYALYYYVNKKNIEEAYLNIQKSLDINNEFIPSIALKIILLENEGQYNDANSIRTQYKNQLNEYYNRNNEDINNNPKEINDSIQIKDIDFSQMSGMTSYMNSNMTNNMISMKNVNKPNISSNNMISKSSSINSIELNCSRAPLNEKESEPNMTLLGKGGFGCVYLEKVQGEFFAAKHINLPENISEEKKQQVMNLIKSEIKATLSLKHRNIICQNGFLKNVIYMEYASGKDLRKLLSSRSLNMKFKLYLISEIAHGLLYLHTHNIIHGDLKCLNILLSKPYNENEEEYPVPKICDFGLCITMDDTNQLKGFTARWAAPEVMLKKAATKMSDIFSFGMVIYEIISQKIPFDEIQDNKTVMKMIIDKKIPNIEVLQCEVNIKSIIKRALSYDESLRPTIVELSKEIDEIYKKEVNKKLCLI